MKTIGYAFVVGDLFHYGHLHFLMENPDVDSDVKAVELITVLTNKGILGLHSYRYFKNDIEYFFVWDEIMKYFEQVMPKPVIPIPKDLRTK